MQIFKDFLDHYKVVIEANMISEIKQTDDYLSFDINKVYVNADFYQALYYYDLVIRDKFSLNDTKMRFILTNPDY